MPLVDSARGPFTDNARVWGPVVAVIALVLANILTAAANENSAAFKWISRRTGHRAPKLLFIRCVGGADWAVAVPAQWNLSLGPAAAGATINVSYGRGQLQRVS